MFPARVVSRQRILASALRPFVKARAPTRMQSTRVAWAKYSTRPRGNASKNVKSSEPEDPGSPILALIVLVGLVAAGVSFTSGFESAPASLGNLTRAVTALRASLGEETISTDPEDLHKHGTSEWSSSNIKQLPIAIAYPKTTAEVSNIAEICTKYKIPMIPYSGGSSLEGNFSAPHGGITIDLTYMDRIWPVREDDMDVAVQPGVSWMDLNEKIKGTGLFFPVDPGPTAMIGGMIGTSCSGTNAFRYGTMRDWVVSQIEGRKVNLTVVLPDGKVIRTKRRPRKSAAGYSLNHLFVGSEGTLGIITEATLKLAPIPQATSVAVATFPTLRDAASTAAAVIRSGIPVGAMEIMDEVSMNVVNRAGTTHKTWDEVPTLFFKFSGHPAVLKIHETEVLSIASKNKVSTFESTSNPEEQKALWSARKESLWSMLALRKEGEEVWPTDVAVPISRLVDMFETGKKELDSLGLYASVLGHIGDGNFHETILFNPSNPREKARVEQHVKRMTQKALDFEGTSSGEHGIGLTKKDDILDELGPDTIDVMRKIKHSLDPLRIMNPGKIFDLTPLPKTAVKIDKDITYREMLDWEDVDMRIANQSTTIPRRNAKGERTVESYRLQLMMLELRSGRRMHQAWAELDRMARRLEQEEKADPELRVPEGVGNPWYPLAWNKLYKDESSRLAKARIAVEEEKIARSATKRSKSLRERAEESQHKKQTAIDDHTYRRMLDILFQPAPQARSLPEYWERLRRFEQQTGQRHEAARAELENFERRVKSMDSFTMPSDANSLLPLLNPSRDPKKDHQVMKMLEEQWAQKLTGHPSEAPIPEATANAGNQSDGKHALAEYQQQLMTLEAQNKKRLEMARAEREAMEKKCV